MNSTLLLGIDMKRRLFSRPKLREVMPAGEFQRLQMNAQF